MGRYIGPKCRLCRSVGKKLFLKGEKCNTTKCIFEKRKNPPGQHGAKPLKFTVYKKRLKEKQILKHLCGINETQLKNYFEKAKKMKGSTGENLLLLLERRLDNVLYRLGFAPSRSFARQAIVHGNIFVNNRKVKSPGYQVKINDEVKYRDRLKENELVKKSVEHMADNIPPWLSLDKEKLIGKVVSLPDKDNFSFPVDETLIVEFYSR